MRLSNAGPRAAGRRIGGAISMTIARFSINGPFRRGAGRRGCPRPAWFAVDAVCYAIGIVRLETRRHRAHPRRAGRAREHGARAAAPVRARFGRAWVVAVAGPARILGIAWNIATAPGSTPPPTPRTPSCVSLGLSGEPAAVVLAQAEVEAAERGRAPADCAWNSLGRSSSRCLPFTWAACGPI